MTTTDTPAAPTTLTIDAEQPTWGTAPAAAPSTDSTGPGVTPPSMPSHPVTPPAARFFDTIRRAGVVRSPRGSGRLVAGVASGLARRWDLDPIVVRTAFIVLTFLGGLGVSLYGLAWLFLPQPDGHIHAQRLLTGRLSVGFIGALLATLAVTDSGFALPIAAVTVALILLLVRNRHPHIAATTTAPTH
ncbi:MAG: PspC domain-containing protein [Kineosporiaceae bacterium]